MINEDNKPERKRFKLLQIRWHEALGRKECPYAHRWVLNLGLFSIRLHQWIRSDDKRYMHDHPYWFITILLRGAYDDVSSNGIEHLTAGDWRYRPASHCHYVRVPVNGAWSLLLTGPSLHQWGFWVNGRRKRPLKYFHHFGHPPCSEQ